MLHQSVFWSDFLVSSKKKGYCSHVKLILANLRQLRNCLKHNISVGHLTGSPGLLMPGSPGGPGGPGSPASPSGPTEPGVPC